MITYGAIKSGEQMVRVGGDVRDLDIHLPEIRPDQSAQPRENLHNDRIAEYAESMKAGDQFPPLTVFHDGEVYWLADGFHRFYAAQHAGRKHIRCYVRQGGLRDAILYSVGANAKHGLPRTDEDKRRAVVRLLADAEWGAWSDNDIRKQCKVSLSFVQKLRKETSYREVSEKVAPPPSVPEKVRARAAAIEAEGGNPRFYKNKHGNVAVMNVSGINAGRTLSDPEKQANVLRSAWEKASPEAKAIFAATPEAMEIKASEPETVEQPATPFRNIFDELVSLWKEADAGVRQDFKAYITGSEFVAKFNPQSSDGERSVAAAGSEHHSADHVSPPVRSRNSGSGSVNEGGEDVTDAGILKTTDDAPQVGQTSLAAREGEKPLLSNSPDGANEAEEIHLTGRGTRERGEHGANRRNGGAVERRIREGSPAGEAEDASVTSSGGENPAFNSQSAVPTAEPEDVTRPQAPSSGTLSAGPHSSAVSGGEPGIPSSDDGGAKMGGCANSNPGQTGEEPARISTQSEQAASFTNPRCQKPETCHLVHSRNECFDCNIAWSKRPKDEQVRLWAEAIQAARAAA